MGESKKQKFMKAALLATMLLSGGTVARAQVYNSEKEAADFTANSTENTFNENVILKNFIEAGKGTFNITATGTDNIFKKSLQINANEGTVNVIAKRNNEVGSIYIQNGVFGSGRLGNRMFITANEGTNTIGSVGGAKNGRLVVKSKSGNIFTNTLEPRPDIKIEANSSEGVNEFNGRIDIWYNSPTSKDEAHLKATGIGNKFSSNILL